MDTLKEKDPNSAKSIIAITFLVCMAYSILRYHILGDVPWKDLSIFILNKGISLCAFILLTFNFSFGPLNNLGVKIPSSWLNSRKEMGITGFLLAFIHVLMSFLIFNPQYISKFFDQNNSLSLIGGLSMLTGIISFIILWAYNLSFQTFIRADKAFMSFITSRKFLLISMLFALMHLFFMGHKGWMNPGGWNGGLPPISLVGFSFGVIGYLINLLGRK